MLKGFLNQYAAVDATSGHHVNVVLTAQPPEDTTLPVILDITVAANVTADPNDWAWLAGRIATLRVLKNSVFRSILEDECLQLFR